jgi:beta-glucosidase
VIPEPTIEANDIQQAADQNDLAIFTISRNAGEGADRKVIDNFNLTDLERDQLKAVAAAFHAKNKKMIVILNIGGAVETASWRDDADAILLAWQPGEEAGNAIADIMSGAVNPSGKLAATFPLKYEDEPSADSFPGEPAANPTQVIYKEGIYVGYRYFSSFNVKTAFPFGFGLSYTKFSYSNLTLSSPVFKNKITVKVTVTNTGNVAGKEVAELYLSAPQKKLDKPSEELKGFAKTSLLKPGASQTLIFTIDTKDLASFYTDRSAWIADAGIYTVKIGASSEDIKLGKKFSLGNEVVAEKVNKALAPSVTFDELKSKNTSAQ